MILCMVGAPTCHKLATEASDSEGKVASAFANAPAFGARSMGRVGVDRPPAPRPNHSPAARAETTHKASDLIVAPKRMDNARDHVKEALAHQR